jgi:tetraacyldisaccharide 4'-kinase
MSFLSPGQPVRTWLYWASWCYELLVRCPDWCYRRGWLASKRLPCAVISVGNLTVGGTGKTPMVMLVTEWVQAKGLRVAILSRGYKRTSTAPHLLVSDGSQVLVGPSEAGDEPFLIAQRFPKAIVAVGADRGSLGRWVLAQFPVGCMILDDGFQHRSLQRNLDLVLLDATDAAGLDALLPAGRLRGPLQELARADAVVITRADVPSEVDAIRRRVHAISDFAGAIAEVVFTPESVVSVLSSEQHPITWGRAKRAWLVSGIGNSGSFRRSAKSIGLTVVGETALADHHSYSQDDVGRIRLAMLTGGADIVVTTEKDGGKLASLLEPNDPWWMLRLQARVMRGEEELRLLIDRALSNEMPRESRG